MVVPHPHDRPISVHAMPGVALEAYSLRLPRWPIFRLLSRNPLVRRSDRIEALVSAFAIMVSLLAVPVAAAVGTEVYDSRRDVYVEQSRTRHVTTAIITDDSGAQKNSRTGLVSMPARWSTAGAGHTGAVKVPSATKSGDGVAIWVDSSGALADEPMSTGRAAADGVTAAVAIWASVAAAAAMLVAGARAVCNRVRAAGWERDIDTLAGSGEAGGRP